jgi:hypothetical protein
MLRVGHTLDHACLGEPMTMLQTIGRAPTLAWTRTAPRRYEAQAPSGRIYQIVCFDRAWDIVTSDGRLAGSGFPRLSQARAYCEAFEHERGA